MDAAVFIATSLDGFIARPDGALDWLDTANPGDMASPDDAANPQHGDLGFGAFMSSVDALVMGRNTFDFVLTTGIWAYGETPVIVMTHRALTLPDDLAGRVETSSATPSELAGELEQRGIHSVYVDGGTTIRSFLAAGLVSRIIITRLPVLIGSGIPLFGELPADVHLELVRSESFVNGCTQAEYVVRR